MNLSAIRLTCWLGSRAISHPPAADVHSCNVGRRHRWLAAVAVALVCLFISGIAAAQANVRINKVSGMLQAGRWVETVELENVGNAPATDWLVTSQPYNGNKWQYGFDRVNLIPKSGPNVTHRGTATINIPAGAKIVVTFQYLGAEAKVWNNWYVDVYTTVDNLIINNRHTGLIGMYKPIPVPPRQQGYNGGFLFPYTNALATADAGPIPFLVQLNNVSLPSGWTLESLGPDRFTLDVGESQFINASFSTSAGGNVGETALVDFTILATEIPGGNGAYLANIGVQVVPEPSIVALLAGGLAVLLVSVRSRVI